MNRKTELLARAYFVVIVFTLIALVIAYRVIQISIVDGEKWRKKADANVQWREVSADRGNIYSDNESLLATSLQFFEIRLDLTTPRKDVFNKNVDSLALMLSNTIRPDLSKSQWKEKLVKERKKGNRYLFIKKDLDVEEMKMVKSFPMLRYNKFKGGCIVNRYSTRAKPYREFASRTIGSDRENAQKTGLEGYFDKFLKGPVDKRLMKRVSATQDLWIPIYDPSEFQSRRGSDIKTTLNMHLQDIVHTELEKAVLNNDAKEGVAILMEVKTGAIKAMSNLTNYGENVREVRNIAIGSSTEPGSTFKLATVLALLQDSVADVDTKVNLNGGTWNFYGETMKDSERHNRSEVTMKEAFAISSNVGIAKLADQYYNKNEQTRLQYVKTLRQIGIEQALGIEIEGEGMPYIKDPVKDKKDWWKTSIPWMAHGYETSMTPLQILNLYNTVANGGVMMKPYIVSDIVNENGKVKHIKPIVLKNQICRNEVIEKAKEMLREVVENGTAKNLNDASVEIAGKTGTTRVNYSKKDEYAKYNASFAGFFPYEDPQYSMIVVLYEPKKAFYGSAVAAPVFKAVAEKTIAWKHEMASPINTSINEQRIVKNNTPEASAGFKSDFDKIFDYVGIDSKTKTSNSWVEVDPFETKMLIEDKNVRDGKIPDVRGMGARDAMFLLENIGCQVGMHGRGKVVRQTILPGTRANKQKVEIYLN